MIVAEGYDAGKILAPEEKFGLNTLQQFIFDATNDGSSLTNLLSGSMQQYDIVYVDWKNGVDYLQRNAYLLETIIQWVNANKQPLNGVMQPNVVLGQSMGGVIARYALKDMENTALNHNTRLFISDDAPQQGANVPQGYQHLARHARSLYIRTGFTAVVVEIIQLIRGGVSPLAALSLADQPASKEMLINFVNGSNSIDNTVHNTWQTELKNIGYPAGFAGTPFRFVAVSNGSECANPQPFGPGANLLTYTGKANTRILGDLAGIGGLPLAGFLLGQPPLLLGVIPGRNDFAFDFAVNAQADGASNQVYKGKITYTKKILYLLPVSVNITNKSYNSSASTLPYDYFPGGYYSLGTINSGSNQTVFYKYNITVTNQPSFNFVPTVSALDIGSNNVTLTKADYLTSYVGANPPPTPKNTPFQNFITAFNVSKINEQHISIEARNGDWIAAELNSASPSANCSYLCGNQIINGPAQFCDLANYSFNLPSGSSISWSATPFNMVSFTSPNSASTNVNQIGSGNVTLIATIYTPCGTLTIQKTVQVGPIPLSSYSIAGATTVYASAGYNYALTFPIHTLPSNVFWRVPTGWSILSGQGTTNIHIWTGSQGGQVQCDFDNTCGSPTGIFITAVIGNGGPDPESTTPETSKLNTGLQLTATPNPANNIVKVTIFSSQKTVQSSDPVIRQIRITDKTGSIKKELTFNNKNAYQSVNVSDLQPDIYILQVYTGKEWLSSKLVIVK
ncbi:MAG: T9SS type A sorting domain-containing protein [Ferruginibacter sp.]